MTPDPKEPREPSAEAVALMREVWDDYCESPDDWIVEEGARIIDRHLLSQVATDVVIQRDAGAESIETLRQRIAELEQEVRSGAGMLAKLHEEKNDLDQRIAELERQLDEMCDSCQDVDHLSDKVDELERKLVEARNFGEEVCKEYNELLADQRILRCAYCDAEYPPGTPPTQHEALTAHIAICPKHPMREVERERDEALAQVAALREALRDVLDSHFDMSPLEYAASRGLSCMSDDEGTFILAGARRTLADTASAAAKHDNAVIRDCMAICGGHLTEFCIDPDETESRCEYDMRKLLKHEEVTDATPQNDD